MANYPSYVSSAATEVIDLAAAAGLVLDPWQCYILRHGLGETTDGQWASFHVSTWVPRQNGKGAIIEALELAWLFLFGERLVLHSAHEYKTAQEAFLRIRGLIQGTPAFDSLVNRYWAANGEQGIELRTGQRLRFVARSKSSGRGFSGDKNVLDEAQDLTAEQMAALLPTMSARPNPQLWTFGTPPREADAWAYTIRDAGEAGTDPRMAYFDWGLGELDPSDVEGMTVLDDIGARYRANPALGIRLTSVFVEGERRLLGPKFAPERLGTWLPRASGVSEVITAEQWRAIGQRSAGRPAPVAFAIDVSPDRQYASIALAGLRTDGLVQVAIVEHRAGTDWIADRMAALRERWNPLAIVIDGRSPAVSLCAELAEVGIRPPDDAKRPQPGDLAVMAAADVATAWGMFVDAARQGRMRHSDDAPLNLALAGAKLRTLGDGSAWARRSGGADITPLVGATNASWALVTLREIVTDDAQPSAYYL